MLFGFSPILIIAAVVPAILLIRFVYNQDKLDRESPRLIKSLVLLGALSTLIAIVLETIGDFLLQSAFDENSLIYIILMNFIVVGISEEWSKYVMLKRRTWKDSEFNCMFDGIVYAVTVSLGFALWENIKYVTLYGFTTALVRAVTAIPGHASFGVLMGVFYGMAKRAEINGRVEQSKNSRFMCVALPAFVHGMYDFLATIDGTDLLFIPFILIVFFVCYKIIKNSAKNDTYISKDTVDKFDPRNVYGAPRKDNDYSNYKYRQ